MDIVIKEADSGDISCIQFLRDKGNIQQLRVGIPYYDKSVDETRSSDQGWQVHLSRRRPQSSIPFVLKIEKKSSDKKSWSSMCFNIYSTLNEGCKVILIGGKLDDTTPLSVSANCLQVTKNVSAGCFIKLTSLNGNISVNAKIECPKIQLCAINRKNISLKCEAQLICQKLFLTGLSNKIEGKILAWRDELHINVNGDLHLSTHCEIGKCIYRRGKNRKVARSVNIDVSGNVWNYGEIVAGRFVNLQCYDYSSCEECPEETVQNGYFAIKSRANIELKNVTVDEQNSTIKDLLNAIKNLDKETVTALLENGADPLAKISYRNRSENALEYAMSIKAATSGQDGNAEIKLINDIVRILNWWLRRRGGIISGDMIQISCKNDLGDCSQLTAPRVHLQVNGNAIIEQASCWSCGVVSGFCRGSMIVHGTWKLNKLGSLHVLGDFQITLCGKVITKDGGNIKIEGDFINDNHWYNQSECLSIECGSVFQKKWATVTSKGILEFIINNETVVDSELNNTFGEQHGWDGEIDVFTLLMITIREKVQCHADVKCHNLIKIVLERNIENRNPSFEIAGQFSIEDGPLVVDVEQESFAESNLDELIVSGKLNVCGMTASNIRAHLLPKSEIRIKESLVNPINIYILIGNMIIDKGSFIDVTIVNENQKLVIECRNELKHNGHFIIQHEGNKSVTGLITTKTFINKGIVKGFDTLDLNVSDWLHNSVYVIVQQSVTITGQGKFTNDTHGGLICNDGPVTISDLKDISLMTGSEICGKTITLEFVECVVNEGTIEAELDLTIALSSLDNTTGTLLSNDSSIAVHWLGKESCFEQKLDGIVLARKSLLLTTVGKMPLTIKCTDKFGKERFGENPVYEIPGNGLNIKSPFGSVIIKSALDGPSGNELLNISTGIGFLVHSKSYIPNCTLSVHSQEPVFFGTNEAGAKLLFNRIAMVTSACSSGVVLKGNVVANDKAVIICKNVNLTIEGTIHMQCNNYSSCEECEEETVQNGYFAIKSRSNIELNNANVDEQNSTITELHSAIKRLDKEKVTALLENGADPLAKISCSELSANAFEYAMSMKASIFGHDDNNEVILINDIVRILKWWLRRRDEIISRDLIQISCKSDLGECSQLTAPSVHLQVNGNVIVKQDSCWSCGIVSGFCRGSIIVHGTWKSNQLNSLHVLGDFEITSCGKIITKSGGNIKIERDFINDNQWYNQSECLSIECGSVYQKKWATVTCQGILEFIINNETVIDNEQNKTSGEQQRWDGEINVLTLVMITIRGKVQCHADVKCHNLIQIVLERNIEDKTPSFEIAGQFSVENGPLKVDIERESFAESNLDDLIVSGTVAATGLIARNIHAHFLSKSVTNISSVDPINTHILIGNVTIDKESLVDVTIMNENQKFAIECQCEFNHNGDFIIRHTENKSVTGLITAKTFINNGIVKGFDILDLNISHWLRNCADVMVQQSVTITGQGKFTNDTHGGLICKNGPVTIGDMKDISLMNGSEICGRTITLEFVGCVVNEGTIEADLDLTLELSSLDNTKGTLLSHDSSIAVHWLGKESCFEQKLDGLVLARKSLSLTTVGKMPLTIQCTDKYGGEEIFQSNPVYTIPENGLNIVCPFGCVNIKSTLDGPSGNELVNISTGIGCLVHSKSYIPNCALSVHSQEPVFFGTDTAGAELIFNQIVMVASADFSKVVLKGNVVANDKAVIICKNVNLTVEGTIYIGIYCEIVAPELCLSTTSRVLMCYKDDVDSEICIKCQGSINLFGSIQRQTEKSATLKFSASNATICGSKINITLFAAQVENVLVFDGTSETKLKQICADVGTFSMKDKAVLSVTGSEDSGIISKIDQVRMAGRLHTMGEGTLLIQSVEKILLESLCCEFENKSTRFESIRSIDVLKECKLHIRNSDLTFVTTGEEGKISVNGHISSNCLHGEVVGGLVIESYGITLGHLSCTQLKNISLYAEHIIDLQEETTVQSGGCVTIEAKVLKMRGTLNNVQSITINQWSSTFTGSFTDCGEIKAIPELLLVNSGKMRGRKIGISAPVFLSVPFNENVVEVGCNDTQTLVVEGLLSIWVKSAKQASFIKLSSLLHFEFSSATSSMPNKEDLDLWKTAMQNVLKPATAADANMQNILDSAMKIKNVACNLGSASLLCQDIMKISESIRDNGVERFQMTNIVGALEKAHNQYSNINYSLRDLLNTDPLLKKLKKKCSPIKKFISDIFGKKTFSETLTFDLEEQEYGTVQENTFFSKRDSYSEVKVSRTYQAQSKQWENESHIKSCGDVFICADTIEHRGTDARLLKACQRLIMTGKKLKVTRLEGSVIGLKGSTSVEIENLQSDQLNVESKEVEIKKANVKQNATILANQEVNIDTSTFENLLIEGETVSVGSTKVNDCTIEASDLNVTDVKGQQLCLTAENHVEVCNTEVSDTLSVSSQQKNIVLKGDVKAKNAQIQAIQGKVEIENFQSDQLNVESKEVEIQKAYVNKNAKILANQEVNVDKSSFGNLVIEGETVSVGSTKVNDCTIEASDLNVTDVKGKQLCLTAENQVEVCNTEASETLSVSSKHKNIVLEGDIKAQNAQIQAAKGTVVFDGSDKASCKEFRHLDLKQRSMGTSLENLLSRLKISDQLNLAVDDHLTLNAQRNLSHGLSLEAKSINVNSNISSKKSIILQAKEGGIHVQKNKQLKAESVTLKATKDIYHDKGSVIKAEKDVIEESSKGSIKLNAAHVSGGQYVELNAAKDISISAVGGDNSQALKSSVCGGTGYEYDDDGQKRKLGLKLKAGKNLCVDASTIGSKADNLIFAKREIEFKARNHQYCSKRETKYGFLKLWKTETEEWSTHVDRSEVTSSGGRNIIHAEEGGIKSTATDLRAQENQLVAKGNITLQDLVTKTEKFSKTCDSFGGFIYNKRRRETNEQSHASVIIDESAYANTTLMSKEGDIHIKGSEINTKGNLLLKADQGKIRNEERVLNHTVDEEKSGFFMTKPDKETNTEFSLGYKVEKTNIKYQTAAGKKINVNGSTHVKAKEFESDVSCNVLGSFILDAERATFSAPELKSSEEQMSGGLKCGTGHMSLYYKYTKKNSFKRANAGLNVGGTMNVRGNTFSADQGHDINVQQDMILDVDSFEFRGAQEQHQSTSHELRLGINTTELTLGYSGEFSNGTTYKNQKTNVGGNFIARNVKKGDIDAANITCKNISGTIENLTMQSRQDSHQSTGFGLSLGVDLASNTPTVEVGANYLQEKSVSDIASIVTLHGGSENLNVGSLNLTASEIKFAGNVHNFANNIVSKDLNDISDNLSVNVKVGKPNPKKLKVTLGVAFRNKRTAIRGTISSTAGKVNHELARKVNTDIGKTREIIHDFGASATITVSKSFEGSQINKKNSFEFSGTGSVRSGNNALTVNMDKSDSEGLAGNISCQSGNKQFGAGISQSSNVSFCGKMGTDLFGAGFNKSTNSKTGEESFSGSLESKLGRLDVDMFSNDSTGEQKCGAVVKTDYFNAGFNKSSNSKSGEESFSGAFETKMVSLGFDMSSTGPSGEQKFGAMVKTDDFNAGFNKSSNSRSGEESFAGALGTKVGSFGVDMFSNDSTGEQNFGAMVKTEGFNAGFNKSSNRRSGEESITGALETKMGSLGVDMSSNNSTGEQKFGAMVKTNAFNAGFNKSSNRGSEEESFSGALETKLGSLGVDMSSNDSTGEQKFGAMVKTNDFNAGFNKSSNSRSGEESITGALETKMGSLGVDMSSNDSTGEQKFGAMVKTDDFNAGFNKSSNSKTGGKSFSGSLGTNLGSFGVDMSSNDSTGEQQFGAKVKTDDFNVGFNKSSNSRSGEESFTGAMETKMGSLGVDMSSNDSTGEQKFGAMVKTDDFNAGFNKSSNRGSGEESFSGALETKLGSLGVDMSSNDSTGEQKFGAMVKTNDFNAGFNKSSNSRSGEESITGALETKMGSLGVDMSSNDSTGEQKFGAMVKTDDFNAGFNKSSNSKTGGKSFSGSLGTNLGSFGVDMSSNDSTVEQKFGAMVKTDDFNVGFNKSSNSRSGEESFTGALETKMGSLGVDMSSNDSTGEQKFGAMVKTDDFNAGFNKSSNRGSGEESFSGALETKLGSLGADMSSNDSTGEQKFGAMVKTNDFNAGFNKSLNSRSGEESITGALETKMGSLGVDMSSNDSTGEQKFGAMVKTDDFNAGFNKSSNSKTGGKSFSGSLGTNLGSFGVDMSSNDSTGEQKFGAMVKTDDFNVGFNKSSNSRSGEESFTGALETKMGSLGVDMSSNDSTGEQKFGAMVKTDDFNAGFNKSSNSKTGGKSFSGSLGTNLGSLGVDMSSNDSTGEQKFGAMVKTDDFNAGFNKSSNSRSGEESITGALESKMGSLGVDMSSNDSTGEQKFGAVVKTDDFNAGFNKSSNRGSGEESFSGSLGTKLGSLGVDMSSNDSTGEQKFGAMVKTDDFNAGFNKSSNRGSGEESFSGALETKLGSLGVDMSSNDSTGEQKFGAMVKTNDFNAGFNKSSNSRSGEESITGALETKMGSLGVDMSSNDSTGEQKFGAMVKTDDFNAGFNKSSNSKTGGKSFSGSLGTNLGSLGVDMSSNDSTGEQKFGAMVKTDDFNVGFNKSSNSRSGEESFTGALETKMGSLGVDMSSNDSTGEKKFGAMVKTDYFNAGFNKSSNRGSGEESFSGALETKLGSLGVDMSSNDSTGEQKFGAIVKTNDFNAGFNKSLNSRSGEESITGALETKMGSLGVDMSSNDSTGEQKFGAMVKTDDFNAGFNKSSNSKTGGKSFSGSLGTNLGSFGVDMSSNDSTGEQKFGAMVKTDDFNVGFNKSSNSRSGEESFTGALETKMGSLGVDMSSNDSTGEQKFGAMVKTDDFNAGFNKSSNSKTGGKSFSGSLGTNLGSLGVDMSSNDSTGEQKFGAMVKTDDFNAGFNKSSNSRSGEESITGALESKMGSLGVDMSSNDSTGEQKFGAVVKTYDFNAGFNKSSNRGSGEESFSGSLGTKLGSLGIDMSSNDSTGEQKFGAMVKTDDFNAGFNKSSNNGSGEENITGSLETKMGSFGVDMSSNDSNGEHKFGAMVKTDDFNAGFNKSSNTGLGKERFAGALETMMGSLGVDMSSNDSSGEQKFGAIVKADDFNASFNKSSNSRSGEESFTEAMETKLGSLGVDMSSKIQQVNKNLEQC